MAFTSMTEGAGFSAGFFLKNPEHCVRESMMVPANHGQKKTINGRVIVPAGAVIPANGATAKGLLYEDIDVTDGDAFGSVVTEGTVYGAYLPAAPADAAAAAMTGITVADAPTITRPY
jgi:hypothetical protein